jgi:Uma2 family endonuclease
MSLLASNELVQPAMQPVRGRPTWEIAYLYPEQGQWQESEYLTLGTNHLIEFDDGCIEVLPTPTLLHQFIVKFLFAALNEYVTAYASGVVLFAPLPVRLWPSKYREPDIVYVRPERIRDVRGQSDGADLVMEVLSEGHENRERDLKTKREEYSQAGISEYWIVDYQERRITVLVLEGQTYRTHGEFGRGSQATSVLFPGFSVNVDAVFCVADASSIAAPN